MAKAVRVGDALYFGSAIDMAKVFRIGLPFAKVVVENSRKATIVELTEAEWSEVWHDAIPLSLTRCGQRRAQNADAQDGQGGHSGSGSRGDGGAEDGANAQDGHGAEDGANAEDGRGAEDGANAQDGQGAEDGANAQDGQGAEDGENAQDGQGHDQDDSESEEEPGSEEAHDLEVMLVLRGAPSGAGITQDGILLLARSKGSGLAMSASLIFRFRVEKGCDWMRMTVVARGGFETQGRVIADDVTRRVGLLHDELLVQFSVGDSQAPATLLETSLCNHTHDTATKSTVSSAQGSDCLMALRLQAGYLRLGASGAVEGRLEGKSSALLTNAQESSLSFKLPTTPNSTFSLHEVHSKLVGKLAFVANHKMPPLAACVGLPWSAVTAASAGDCFQEDMGMGWPAEVAGAGVYLLWGKDTHAYTFSMERSVAECGDMIVAAKQRYSVMIMISHDIEWQKLKCTHYILHPLRKRRKTFPLLVKDPDLGE